MDLTKIKIGDQAPTQFNAVIEIPKDSAIKYEIDAKTGELEVDRSLDATSTFPFSYGFIPETLADDDDALDAMVISPSVLESKSVIICRPIGVLKMEDEHGEDNKILAILTDETSDYSNIKDLADLDLSVKEKISLFFRHYKESEKEKWSKVYEFGDKEEAINIIKKCINEYQK